jgi:1-acyl-sn-glycerol-3-phosphate acyltransferase
MLYSILRGLGRLVFGLLGLKVEGLAQLPPSGPVIIAANHVSNWDPLVVAIAINRPIHFMGKAALFKHRILGQFFTKLNAFPVRKDIPDRKAIRHALQVLAAGEVLGIFPEGRRNIKGEVLAEPGVIMIALKSGAPIIPVACRGTARQIPWGWSDTLMVRLGEPYHLHETPGHKLRTADMEKLSLELIDKIHHLID